MVQLTAHRFDYTLIIRQFIYRYYWGFHNSWFNILEPISSVFFTLSVQIERKYRFAITQFLSTTENRELSRCQLCSHWWHWRYCCISWRHSHRAFRKMLRHLKFGYAVKNKCGNCEIVSCFQKIKVLCLTPYTENPSVTIPTLPSLSTMSPIRRFCQLSVSMWMSEWQSC